MAPTVKTITNLLQVCVRGPSGAESGRFCFMAKVNLQPTDGFQLHGWMVTELHLDGGDLLTFALVHQFAQSGAGIYKGNTSYLSGWTGWSENTSRRHLADLVQKGLIEEVRGRDNNVPFCYYKLAPDFYEKHPAIFEVSPLKKRENHPSKIEVTAPQKLRGEYTYIENTRGNIHKEEREKKEERFRKPTVSEVKAYCEERRNTIDAQAFVDFYDSKGWKVGNTPMRDWKAAVRTWEAKRKNDPQPPTPSPKQEKKESLVEYYRRILKEINEENDDRSIDEQ